MVLQIPPVNVALRSIGERQRFVEEGASSLQQGWVVLQCVPGRRREVSDGESVCPCSGVLGAGCARPMLGGTGIHEEEKG